VDPGEDGAVTEGGAPLVLAVRGLAKAFGALRAVDGVDLEVREGEIFALLGPSGCGKTTLMRAVAGFERPDGGRVLLDGRDVTALPPHRRPVNLMFQSYALFPHMSVRDNVAYGLRREGRAEAEIRRRVGEMLDLVALSGEADRRPDQLSGGQRQRVALARALVKRPRLLLLDEPLGALDRKLRDQTRAELKRLRAELNLSFLIVTHDQDEALSMADRMAVMVKGRILQAGRPADLYERPTSRAVAAFLGEATLLDGVVAADGAFVAIEGFGNLAVSPGAVPGPAVAVLRPEIVALEPPSGTLPSCVVVETAYLGDRTLATLRCGPHLVKANVPAGVAPPRLGARLGVAVAPGDVVLLPGEGA
jgi:ABC-type Fe3+/spermidine/putrescine transport system ATPase subunit